MKHALPTAVAAFTFVALLTGAQCNYPPPEPPYVITHTDAGRDAELMIPDDCLRACDALLRFGCPEAETAGRTCGSVCAAAVKERITIKTQCIADAETIEQLRACNVRCKGGK